MPRHSRSPSHSSQENRSRSPSSEVEGVRVHVGELPVGCSERDLEHIFKKFGPLVEVWMARIPPCFAFVVFRDQEDAEEAIRAMNGRTICGRRVRVSLARPRVEARGPRRTVSYNGDGRCYQCGERGHLSRNCYVYRSRRNQSPRRQNDSSSERSSTRSRSRSRDRKAKKREKSREKASSEERLGEKESSHHKDSKRSSAKHHKDRDDEGTKDPSKKEKRRSSSTRNDDQETRRIITTSNNSATNNDD